VQREEDLLKSSAAESERALRKEGENLADVIRKICVVGSNLMSPALIDQLKRRVVSVNVLCWAVAFIDCGTTLIRLLVRTRLLPRILGTIAGDGAEA
jgi:hypothetical protein